MSVFPNLNPYKAVATLVAVGLAVAAIMTLAFSWMARGQEIAGLRAWQTAVVISTTDATVEADAKGIRKPLDPSAVPAAIAKLKRSTDSCLAASAERDRTAQAAVQRADNADRALAAYQTVLRGEYSSAEKRIKALESVKAAPTPDLQCQAIGVDSKAAWEGWQ